jgi:glycosyltransferase involved in cell wall biosynthesis
LKTGILLLTNALNHPLTSRIHYLIRFLKTRNISTRIFDISFYHDNQPILEFLKTLSSFPSRIESSSQTPIRLPSSPNIGNEYARIRQFIHFLYSFYIFITARIICKSINYEVIVAADPFSAFVANYVKRSNTFVVYEDLDSFEGLYSGLRRSLIVFLENLALKRADLVISVSEPLLKRASRLNSNSVLVPNGVNLDSYPEPHRTSREPFMVYAGSFDEWAGLKLVIEAFPLIKNEVPWAKMKIIGDGKERRNLEALVNSLSLRDSILFTGRLSYNEMAEVLCRCSVGIAMFKPSNAANYSSPLKLFDYMAAGLPMIATKIGDISRIVKESESGFVVEWNITKFSRVAKKLLENQSLWLSFHNNALQYVKMHDWNTIFETWLEEIRSRM